MRSALEAVALTRGVAERLRDAVTPLPGGPPTLFPYVDQGRRSLVDPDQVTHDAVQDAFAFGQQVLAIHDPATHGGPPRG